MKEVLGSKWMATDGVKDTLKDWLNGLAADFYIGRTENHEQLFFACSLGTADEREYSGRWNQLLC
jgi:hypothetical protein